MSSFKAISKFFILIFFACSFSAFAQEQVAETSASEVKENIYKIDRIPISAAADSATESRAKAILYGQRQGFEILLKRLGIDEEFAANVSDDLIVDMVASQQILDEKIAGNKYRAFLNVTFSESFAQHYLQDKKFVRQISKKTDSYLIIPIKTTAERFLIWESDNDWNEKWRKLLKNKDLDSLNLAKGDIEDITIFDSKTIYQANYSTLENAFSKYRSSAVVLAYFDFDKIENKVEITLKIIRKYTTKKVRLDFVNVNQLPYQDLADKVAKKTADYLIATQDNLQSEEGQTVEVPENIDIEVLISNLGNWMEVKQKLESENIISNLKIISMSSDLVKVNVSFNKKFEKEGGSLLDLFAKQGLILFQKEEGGYFLTAD